MYYLNIIFLASTIAFSVFTMVCGFVAIMRPAVLAFSVVLCIVEIPASILASIYSDKADYGKPFVLLAKSKRRPRALYTSFVGWFSWIGTAFLIYCAFKWV